MAKYQDVRGVGRSSVVPYIEGESKQLRHSRRSNAANGRQDQTRARLESIGWSLVLKDHGSHWIISRDKNIVEWWPSTAKAVVNKRWRNGVHVHDVNQLIQLAFKTK